MNSGENSPGCSGAAGIRGVGFSVPDKVFVNAEFEEYGLSPEFVEFYFGTKERRHAAKESYTDLGVEAVRRAIADAGIDASEIDMLISNSATNDHFVPSSGTLLHELLGLRKNVMTVNTNVVCCGLIYAYSIASGYIATGRFKNVLVVTGDVMFRMALGQTAFAGVFGDGVGAAVISRLTDGSEGILAESFGTAGEYYDVMGLYSLGSRDNNYGHIYEGEFDIKVDTERGADIPIQTIEWFRNTFAECLARTGLKVSDMDFVSPHQVSIPQIRAQLEAMGVPEGRTLMVNERYGHCGGGTTPIVLTEAKENGLLSPGDLVFAFNCAVGYQYGGMIFRWHGQEAFT